MVFFRSAQHSWKDDRVRHPQHVDLALSLSGAQPGGLRRHLAEQLRSAILRGLLIPGEALPSTRVLASTYGISRGTVVAAYEDLAGEGYVEVNPGGGTFVALGTAMAPQGSSRTGATLDGWAAVPPVRFGPQTMSPDAGEIDLRPGHPSTRAVAHRDWTAAWRAAVSAPLPSTVPPAAGMAFLRSEIAQHLRRSRGFECESHDVVISAGTSDAIALIALALRSTRSGSPRVACEQPGHIAARTILTRLGAEVVLVGLAQGGMDLDSLGSTEHLDAALVTPSHQYPLGGRLDVTRRLELLEWANLRDALIVEDDYDSEFRHGASALPSIASLDRASRVVHVGSFSKVLSPWLRCGYIVTKNREFRDALLEMRTTLGSPVSGVMQDALARYLGAGGLRRHLARARREYGHRRQLIAGRLAGLDAGVALDALDGGLHAVLSWPRGHPAAAVRSALAIRGVLVGDLDDYYGSDVTAPRDGIVIGYGACTDLELTLVLDILRGALLSSRRE